MQIYYIDENLKKKNTAGKKAPDDVAAICEECGFTRLKMPMLYLTHKKRVKHLEIIMKYSFFWAKVFASVPSDSLVIYQHPTLGKRITSHLLPTLLNKKHISIATVIHDLESLRGGIKGVFEVDEKYYDEEIALLKRSECIICHNSKMRKYLVDKGIDEEKIVELKLFDYLTNEKLPRLCDDKNELCIAGNLAPGKSSYIYEMFNNGHNANIHVNLYGANFEEKNIPNLMYQGSFAPDALPGVLKGRFGIVWDGISPKTCAGNTGEYLKYNNPHKTSLYLSAGIPVIVWKKAAIAEFVNENNVGLCVESLYDLETRIKDLKQEEYDRMKKNAEKMSHKVRNGEFLKAAIGKAVGILKQG